MHRDDIQRTPDLETVLIWRTRCISRRLMLRSASSYLAACRKTMFENICLCFKSCANELTFSDLLIWFRWVYQKKSMNIFFTKLLAKSLRMKVPSQCTCVWSVRYVCMGIFITRDTSRNGNWNFSLLVLYDSTFLLKQRKPAERGFRKGCKYIERAEHHLSTVQRKQIL